jgi:hypothetical protein
MALQTTLDKATDEARDQWIAWLQGYGAGNFYDAFVAFAQDAESTCVHCGQPIYLDIVEGGGVPDWGSRFGGPPKRLIGKDRRRKQFRRAATVSSKAVGNGLDYGCPDSPDTGDEGTGGHEPRKREDSE